MSGLPSVRRACAAAVLASALLLPLAASAQTLTVSAAASLTEAFKEIGAKFEATHPGVTLRYNFAASGVLIQQIRQGAPVDVFASADQNTMSRGIDEKLFDPTTRRDFAGNALVLIVPAQDGAAITALADLRKPEIKRIAIGKLATVPAGRYTRQALEAAGLWEALEPKFVQADSVRQALDYVARGEAEVGFVYRTDAAVMRDRVRIALDVQGHAPVTYPVAVVSESKSRAQAQGFIEYLLTPAAREVFDRLGFERPR